MTRRLQHALNEKRIELNLRAGDARAVLTHLAKLMAQGDEDPARLAEALWAREQTGSTALGNGVAVPHARIDGISGIRAAFIRTRTPVAFAAPDAQPVDLFFGLIVPTHANTEHLELLGEIAELLSDEAAIDTLRAATSAATIRATLLERSA